MSASGAPDRGFTRVIAGRQGLFIKDAGGEIAASGQNLHIEDVMTSQAVELDVDLQYQAREGKWPLDDLDFHRFGRGRPRPPKRRGRALSVTSAHGAGRPGSTLAQPSDF